LKVVFVFFVSSTQGFGHLQNEHGKVM